MDKFVPFSSGKTEPSSGNDEEKLRNDDPETGNAGKKLRNAEEILKPDGEILRNGFRILKNGEEILGNGDGILKLDEEILKNGFPKLKLDEFEYFPDVPELFPGFRKLFLAGFESRVIFLVLRWLLLSFAEWQKRQNCLWGICHALKFSF